MEQRECRVAGLYIKALAELENNDTASKRSKNYKNK